VSSRQADAPAFSTASGESLQDEDRFFQVIAFSPQLGEHFVDVHYS
jgi:hypothetical protein